MRQSAFSIAKRVAFRIGQAVWNTSLPPTNKAQPTPIARACRTVAKAVGERK
jgi:hypothetical protein